MDLSACRTRSYLQPLDREWHDNALDNDRENCRDEHDHSERKEISVSSRPPRKSGRDNERQSHPGDAPGDGGGGCCGNPAKRRRLPQLRPKRIQGLERPTQRCDETFADVLIFWSRKMTRRPADALSSARRLATSS